MRQEEMRARAMKRARGRAMPRPRPSCCELERTWPAGAAGSGEKLAALLTETGEASATGEPMSLSHCCVVRPHTGAQALIVRGKALAWAERTLAPMLAAPSADVLAPMLTVMPAQGVVCTDCRLRCAGRPLSTPSSARPAGAQAVTALAAAMADARLAAEEFAVLICEPPGMVTADNDKPTKAA